MDKIFRLKCKKCIFLLVVSGVVLGIVLYMADGSGFGPYTDSIGEPQPAKTLWDWMDLLIIPILLGLIGFGLQGIERGKADEQAQVERERTEKQAETEREIAADNRCEQAMQTYFDRMDELLLEKGLGGENPNDEVKAVARNRTLSVLRRLDPDRKGQVVKFLSESGLILGSKTVGDYGFVEFFESSVDLRDADISEANLQGASLSGANLQGTMLAKANLVGATLTEVIFRNAYLKNTNLENAYLRNAFLDHAQFEGAKLENATLFDADLQVANLENADLRGAQLQGANLTKAFLNGADLTGAHLGRADLTSAELKTADLTRAILEDAILDSADFTGAEISLGQLTGAIINTYIILPDGAIFNRDPNNNTFANFENVGNFAENGQNCHQI
jgi:uncharacterized protein YjbI with pentapeptide repeats